MKNELLFFVSLTIVLVTALTFRFLVRCLVFLTMKAAIEKNETVDPELIAAIGQGRAGPGSDLRRGMLFLAVALATVAAAFLLGREDALRPLLAVAAFPGLVGLAYLSLQWLQPASKED